MFLGSVAIMMSKTSIVESKTHFASLWENACKRYWETTKIDPRDPEVPRLASLKELFDHLDLEGKSFQDFRENKQAFFETIQAVLIPLEIMGETAGSVLAVTFPPAPMIMGAILLLIRGGRGVSDAFDGIMGIFDEVKIFTSRLNIYKGAIDSEEMRDILTKVLVNVLRICALSRRYIKHGRIRTWMKNTFLQDYEIQDALANLKDLTTQEHHMIGALTLAEVHEVREEGHITNLKLDSINVKSYKTYNAINSIRADQSRDEERNRLERIRQRLQPVEASESIYTSILNKRLLRSYERLDENSTFQAWLDRKKPLLWMHGCPGVGKSYLASTIISRFTELHESNANSQSRKLIAFFFFQHNDEKLRSYNNMLRTLIWQVVRANTAFAKTVDEFCQKEDVSNTRKLWTKVFITYFLDHTNDDTLYIVLDGLDEALSHEIDDFLRLLEETYVWTDSSDAPRIQLVVISRDNQRLPLEEHSLGHIPEIPLNPERNLADIARFTSRRLMKIRALRKQNEFKQELITTINERADGSWVWVGLALEALLKHNTESLMRNALQKMPRGIPEMLHYELERLSNDLASSKDCVKQLNLLLAWVSCALRPLTIEELDSIIGLDDGTRVFDLEVDLRTTYSSMFKVMTGFENMAGSVYSEARDSQQPLKDDKASGTDFEDDFGSDPMTTTVALHHRSFYDYFWDSPKTTLIGVDRRAAQLNIVKTCLSLFCDHGKSLYQKEDTLTAFSWYISRCFPHHLATIDLSLVPLEDKKQIASYLLRMFRDEEVIIDWAALWPTNFILNWLERKPFNARFVGNVIDWLRDDDVNAMLEEEDQAWIFSEEPEPTGRLLRPIIDTFAKLWLESHEYSCFQSAVEAFQVLHAFPKKVCP